MWAPDLGSPGMPIDVQMASKKIWKMLLPLVKDYLQKANKKLKQLNERKMESGRARWLTRVIPALWEAELGESLEPRILRSTWAT